MQFAIKENKEVMSDFAACALNGLAHPEQKNLPSRFLYDEIGSSLFEVITVLPEYGVTRAEERLLRDHSPEIIGRLPDVTLVAELGSGSGRKTRHLLNALTHERPVVYCPIDISPTALLSCKSELCDIPSLNIVSFEDDFIDGLQRVVDGRTNDVPILVLFLGSTLGNFSRIAAVRFLSSIRSKLQRGDALLLGLDLIKPIPQLIQAYCDPIGVTAAFNLNLLARINRELNADFDVSLFKHVAKFNREAQSVEMHIESVCDQTVLIRDLDFRLEMKRGETIWTESSHKYAADELVVMGNSSGFSFDAQWIDAQWPFSETLFIAR